MGEIRILPELNERDTTGISERPRIAPFYGVTPPKMGSKSAQTAVFPLFIKVQFGKGVVFAS